MIYSRNKPKKNDKKEEYSYNLSLKRKMPKRLSFDQCKVLKNTVKITLYGKIAPKNIYHLSSNACFCRYSTRYEFTGNIKHIYEVPILKRDKYFIYTPDTIISLIGEKNKQGEVYRNKSRNMEVNRIQTRSVKYSLTRTGEILYE